MKLSCINYLSLWSTFCIGKAGLTSLLLLMSFQSNDFFPLWPKSDLGSCFLVSVFRCVSCICVCMHMLFELMDLDIIWCGSIHCRYFYWCLDYPILGQWEPLKSWVLCPSHIPCDMLSDIMRYCRLILTFLAADLESNKWHLDTTI